MAMFRPVDISIVGWPPSCESQRTFTDVRSHLFGIDFDEVKGKLTLRHAEMDSCSIKVRRASMGEPGSPRWVNIPGHRGPDDSIDWTPCRQSLGNSQWWCQWTIAWCSFAEERNLRPFL